jgi:hypothetical protein
MAEVLEELGADTRRLGLLLLTAAAMSARGYVLIRGGHGTRADGRDWRVYVLPDPAGRETSCSGPTIETALERAVERLQAARRSA